MAIDAFKAIAQEKIKTRKGRRTILRNIILEGNNRGYFHFKTSRADNLFVIVYHVDAVQKNSFDSILPGPKRERKVRERLIISV